MHVLLLFVAAAVTCNGEAIVSRSALRGNSRVKPLYDLRGGAVTSTKAAPTFTSAAPSAAIMAANGALIGATEVLVNGRGAGVGAILFACAGATVSGNYKAYMIGVHAGLAIQLDRKSVV